MKSDLYTKSVLTIIAISLSLIAFNQFKLIPEAHAQSLADMQTAISFCWDQATIRKQTETSWMIRTYC